MNVNKLKGKIIENKTNVECIASKLGISSATLYRKLNKPQKITISDAIKIKDILSLTEKEACDIFLH